VFEIWRTLGEFDTWESILFRVYSPTVVFATKVSLMARVTRLGEFLLIGRLFTCSGQYFENCISRPQFGTTYVQSSAVKIVY
jgi:hypothetical protein